MRGRVTKAVLLSLAASGFIALAVFAPNALQILGRFVGKSGRGLSNRRYYLKSTIGRLADRGLLEFRKSASGKTHARLTARGKHELLKYKIDDLVIHKPWRWDGKWRIVIYCK